MNSRALALLLSTALLAAPLPAQDDQFKAPDTIVLKDGRTVRGLIIKNSVDSVLLQEEFGEKVYPKSEIVRIRDEADIDILFTDVHRRGDLPSWRVIANDLRTHDEIKSFVEIPATTISTGEFKNVPYKSFRVNRDIEMNIYGDPNDPCGVELGIYGSRKTSAKARSMLRSYLAGFLTTRAEIAALYGLDLKGSKADAGDITFEATPPEAEDAFGAWWISLYNKKDLDALRLSDAEYAALTKPADQVIDKRGRLLAHGWSHDELDLSARIDDEDAPVLLKGFFRDKNGDFRLLSQPAKP